MAVVMAALYSTMKIISGLISFCPIQVNLDRLLSIMAKYDDVIIVLDAYSPY